MSKGKFNRLALIPVPGIISWMMRIWFCSCRVTTHNQENCFSPDEKDKQGIASFWHYSIVYILYHGRKYNATAMVSASDDGEYLAKLAKNLGFDTVRGSRNSKGLEGFKAMLRAMQNGKSASIVADGSQGPPRIAQAGAVLLASKTAVPIYPMVWSASSYITIQSWDRTIIPYPFSRIDFYYGEPLRVPGKLNKEGLEHHRLLLENRLNGLYKKAWAHYGKMSH